MDDIIDKIVESVKKGASSVKKGANAVADKGEQFMELTKIRAARARLNEELERNFTELGRELYEMVEGDNIFSETLRSRCALIGHIKAQIADNIAEENECSEGQKKRED